MFNKNHLLNWWVCTFSAMLSSLRNWANHDRYRLRPSTPAQLCWSSSRRQPLRKYKIINSQWFRHQLQTKIESYETVEGRPTRQPVSQVFFRCPNVLTFFASNCLMFAPINSLFLNGPDIRPVTSWRSWNARKNYMCHGINYIYAADAHGSISEGDLYRYKYLPSTTHSKLEKLPS